MNVHDLPMVIFTVVSQMSVGTFIALGVLQLVLGRRHDAKTVERIVAPVLYAIGPVLVFALLVSMLHMGDLLHTFNVIRHFDSSWLTREILFGVSFAAFGFLFALMEWFGKGSFMLRQVIAWFTGLLGIGLLVAESMVYYTLVTVPAWHSWMVPFSFFATAALLGTLAVGSALMITTMIRARAEASAADGSTGTAGKAEGSEPSALGGLKLQVRNRIKEINAPTSQAEWTIVAGALRWIALISAVVAVAIMIAYPLYLGALGQGDAAALASVEVLSGPMLWVRLVCVGATAVILGFFVYRMAETTTLANSRALVVMVTLSLALAFVGEFLGRLLHYESMFRIGL
jgi:anaerobic dimethyl sulfoxide reductase subunit C